MEKKGIFLALSSLITGANLMISGRVPKTMQTRPTGISKKMAQSYFNPILPSGKMGPFSLSAKIGNLGKRKFASQTAFQLFCSAKNLGKTRLGKNSLRERKFALLFSKKSGRHETPHSAFRLVTANINKPVQRFCDGLMRDLVLMAHVLLGIAAIALPVWILLQIKKPGSLLKPVAIVTALAAWLLVVPAGILYLLFYPATKTLILAGNWPWAHSVIMETKEHWGLLLPLIATVAASLVVQEKLAESKKWWRLTLLLALILAIFGRIVSTGGNA